MLFLSPRAESEGLEDRTGVAASGVIIGPNSCARTAAERILLARLEYTRVQRGGVPLIMHGAGDQVVPTFAYGGVSAGLQEGVLLDGGKEFCIGWLKDLVENSGATLFKLTRIGPEMPSGEVEVERTRRWTIVRRSTRARELLPLASTYEETLAGLGRHTRRNIRSARKFAAAQRYRFEVSIDAPLLPLAERARLARKSRPGTRLALAARFEAYADQTGRPFRTVVRSSDGHVVSYACGYFGAPSAAYLLYQLNDPALNAIGPSLLHRAFLLEWLVQIGCREFVFVHGCSGILHHACIRQPLEEVWLMRRSVPGYLGAAVLGLFKPDASIGRLARLAIRT